jgi:hypothetical protein
MSAFEESDSGGKGRWGVWTWRGGRRGDFDKGTVVGDYLPLAVLFFWGGRYPVAIAVPLVTSLSVLVNTVVSPTSMQGVSVVNVGVWLSMIGPQVGFPVAELWEMVVPKAPGTFWQCNLLSRLVACTCTLESSETLTVSDRETD